MNDDIKSELEELDYPEAKIFGRAKHLKELKSKIIKATDFLDDRMGSSVKFSMRLYCILNDITDVPVCDHPDCNSLVKVNPNPTKGESRYDTYIFSRCCSRECMRSSPSTKNKRQSTMNERYGGHNMQTRYDEWKESFSSKYGVSNPMHVDSIKEKSLKNENGEWRISTDEYKAKIKETWEDKYANGHPMRDPYIVAKLQSKIRKSCFDKHGVHHPSQYGKDVGKVHEFNDDSMFSTIASSYEYAEEIAEYFGYHVSRIRSRLAELGLQKDTNTSLGEKTIYDFVTNTLGLEAESSNRTILSGKEIDIYVPSKNVGIEFNGLYWHSENHKHKKYHQDKSIACMEQEIKLVTIWEDDLANKPDLVLNKIRHVLGKSDSRVFARKCSVKQIEQKESNQFYELNHIQGGIRSSISYALVYDGETVACMSFRKIGEGVFDLTRFATSCSVVGGFSKLLNAFKRDNAYDRIETFAALDYSGGNLYEKAGFEKVGITEPNYIYHSNRTTYTLSRYQTMKHKLPNVLDNFDPDLTEKENMNRNGWYRVYDCGSIKYVLENKKPLN